MKLKPIIFFKILWNCNVCYDSLETGKWCSLSYLYFYVILTILFVHHISKYVLKIEIIKKSLCTSLNPHSQ